MPNPPDFCGEWQHAGPLLESLVQSESPGWEMIGPWADKTFAYRGRKGECQYAAILTEAITRAFHAAFVEEGK